MIIGLLFLAIGVALLFFAIRALRRQRNTEPRIEVTMTLRGPDGRVIEEDE